MHDHGVINASAASRVALLLLDEEEDEDPTRAGQRTRWALAGILLLLIAMVLHIGARRGYLAARAFVPPKAIDPSDEDPNMRCGRVFRAVPGVVAVLSGVPSVLAQSAVEWPTSSGGNGHWYATADAPTGDAAIALAASLNGHLATISSGAENDFIKGIYLATGKQWAWLGLRQQNGQATPAAGWYWINGEPMGYLNWTTHDGAFPTGAPDDSPCALPPWGIENGQANQGVMDFTGRWDDLEVGMPTCGSPAWNNTAVIEWDADCNGDGLVDFGQIRRGELIDADANNIPDCCDEGVPCGQNILVNGSFEQGTEQPCGWVCLEVGASNLTGWSVTLNTVDRQRTEDPTCVPEGWIPSDGFHSVDLNGCSIGGRIDQVIPTVVGRRYAVVVQLTVNAGWNRGDLRIHAGSQSFDFTAFRIKQPIQPWSRKIVEFIAAEPSTTIAFESLNREFASQWAGPVIDDARVILLPNAPCPGDLTGDRTVNGVDLAAVLAAWGTNGAGQFDCDANDDGTVDGTDLAIVLGAWGSCP